MRRTVPRAERPGTSLAPSASLRSLFRSTPELRALTLRFVDPDLERRFDRAYLRDNVPYMRATHLLGIAGWLVFGLLARSVLGPEGRMQDLMLRLGVAVPIVLASLAFTYTRWFPRVWERALATTSVLSAGVWSMHQAVVEGSRPDWAYAGLMLILAFAFVLVRIRFVLATVVGVVAVVFHNVVAATLTDARSTDLLFANYFLIVFVATGMAAAYGLERFTRLLFLRELDVETERERAESLLRNTLPDAVVDRLKERDRTPDAGQVADALEQVTVVFIDLVGFTGQTGRVAPEEIVAALDDVFSRLDAIAARHGIEKIKTVGDAYMAVAGAPRPRPDHARAAAEMALDVLDAVAGMRWPTGEPMETRIGMATGPAVAGVIGRLRFAYDLWGDTVNLASRLEANGRPGHILVSEPTYAALRDDGFVFGDPTILVLKGKGPTPARFLLGRVRPGPRPRG